jgi:outer membrane protein assembly factor BamB
MQTILLAFFAATVQGPEALPEWSKAFDLPLSAGLGLVHVGSGQVAARNDRWALGSRESGSIIDADFAVQMFDPLAVELWRSNEDPSGPGFIAFDSHRIDELAFSTNGQLLFALMGGAADELSLRARSSADGSLVWSRDSDQGYQAALGTLGVWPQAMVLVERRSADRSEPSSELIGLDPATGSLLWSRTEASANLAVEPADPAAGVAIVRGYGDGSLRALDVTSGQELWSLPGQGVLAVRIHGSQARLLLGTSTAVEARDLNTGSLLWSQPQGAKVLTASGANTLAVAQDTSAQGLAHSLRLIDGSSGVVLWSSSLPDTGSAQIPRLAADPTGANAVVCANTLSSGARLFRIDGSNGAVLGSSPLSQLPREVVLVNQPGGGVWALAEFTPAAQGFNLAGLPAFTVEPAASALPPSRVLWMETRPLTQRLHLVWAHDSYQATGPQGRYEERDLTSGSLLASFDIPGTFGGDTSFALNAAGDRLAWNSYSPSLGAAWQLDVRSTPTGTLLYSRPSGPAVTTGLHWAQDDLSLLSVQEVGADIRAERIAPTGSVLWTRNLVAPAGQALELGASLRLTGSGDLFFAYGEGSWPASATSRLYRLHELSGQTAASATYNVDQLPGDNFEERIVDAVELVGTNRLALLVDGFGSAVIGGLQQRSRLALVDRQSLLTLANTNLGTAPGLTGYVPAAGQLAALPDGSAALVATFGFTALAVQRIDASSGAVQWSTSTPTGGLARARICIGPAGRTALVQADVPSFGQPTSQSFLAYDSETGKLLLNGNGLGAGLPAGPTGAETLGGLAWTDQQVLITGRGVGASAQAASLRGLQLGSLLDGAEQHSLTTGGQIPHLLIRGTNRAGNVYLLAGSATGTSPGIPLDLVIAPLAFDNYTLSSLTGANGPIFQFTLGLLDSAGTARANLALPPANLPSLVGTTLYHAAIDWSPGQPIDGVSTATSFQLNQ